MGDGQIFLKSLRNAFFNEDLWNEPNWLDPSRWTVPLKSHQDPAPHESVLVWLPGSRSALKQTRIHNAAYLMIFVCAVDLYLFFVLQGADVNQEIDGRLPLHYASDYGQLEVLKYLCSKVPNLHKMYFSCKIQLSSGSGSILWRKTYPRSMFSYAE